MVALASIVSVAVLGLLAVVLWVSLLEDGSPTSALTGENYADLYSSEAVRSVVLNTLQFAITATVVAGVVGGALAWLVERTDFGARRTIYVMTTLSILIPGYAVAMGWIFLLDQQIGILNVFAVDVLGFDQPPFNLVSYVGMGWVQGLSLVPIFFIMTSSSFRAMDASLEEAAQASGAGNLATLTRITLPLLYPGLMAATIFVFTIAIGAFDIPLIIGSSNLKFTFGTFLYYRVHPLEGLPQYGIAASFAGLMVVLALGLTVLYTRVLSRAKRYEVVTGRGYRPKRAQLGRKRIFAWIFVLGYLGLAVVGPVLMIAWMSLQPYLQVPSFAAIDDFTLENFRNLPWELVSRGVSNTVVLMVLAPTITVLASVIFSWVVLRSGSRFRYAFDFVAFLPHAVPNIAFALAALLVATYWTIGPIDLYGTVTLLVIVMGLTHLSFGTRMVNSALVQISRELEEVGEVSGASPLGVLRRITLPLLRPVIVYTWLWLALLVFRELTVVAMLNSRGNFTLSTVVSSMWVGAEVGEAAALTLIVFGVMAAMIAIFLVVTGRTAGAGRDAHLNYKHDKSSRFRSLIG
jgi:iron(III) transport system permease protein